MVYRYLFLVFLWSLQAFSVPQYYCTAANDIYFYRLIGLIGSIHETNYEETYEIAVFDLGLSQEQIAILKRMKKVHVYQIKDKNPSLLSTPVFQGKIGKVGSYSWKPVMIKEALEMFPYVLWLDAGVSVLQSLNHLFQHIQENGYFLCTIGDKIEKPEYSVGWSSTEFVKERFGLNQTDKKWILDQESVSGAIIGASRSSEARFLMDWHSLTSEIRYFEDDGTTPNGYGTGRHDQTLLSVLAYLQHRIINWQDFTQEKPIFLMVNHNKIPFYTTWNGNYVSNHTSIYHSRGDERFMQRHIRSIRWQAVPSRK